MEKIELPCNAAGMMAKLMMRHLAKFPVVLNTLPLNFPTCAATKMAELQNRLKLGL
jgi:hypothetical protein